MEDYTTTPACPSLPIDGRHLLKEARVALNRTPPEDPDAGYIAALIGLIDLYLDPRGENPVCEICGRPPRYRYSWKKLPRPEVPDLWLCEEHKGHAEERDQWMDYGQFYVEKAAGALVRIVEA